MAKVSLSTELPVSARTAWETIGGFNDVAKWHPAVARSEESKRGGSTVRTLHLHGGGSVIEQLEVRDDAARTYSYAILEGPLPVARYRSTLRVKEQAGGRGCIVEWSSEFDPSGAAEHDAVKIVRGIYEAGFDNLRKMFRA